MNVFIFNILIDNECMFFFLKINIEEEDIYNLLSLTIRILNKYNNRTSPPSIKMIFKHKHYLHDTPFP